MAQWPHRWIKENVAWLGLINVAGLGNSSTAIEVPPLPIHWWLTSVGGDVDYGRTTRGVLVDILVGGQKQLKNEFGGAMDNGTDNLIPKSLGHFIMIVAPTTAKPFLRINGFSLPVASASFWWRVWLCHRSLTFLRQKTRSDMPRW